MNTSTNILILLAIISTALCEQPHAGFANDKEVHDEHHIKQHLEDKIEVEKLTEEQQRFHYFSMHDLDKDTRIDGIEILKALTHTHEGEQGPGEPIDNEDNMAQMVDAVLKDMDIDGDGYIDFAEYMKKFRQ